MPAKDKKRPRAKFYQQDIVQRIAPPYSYGVVLRCWHDAEDVPPSNDPLIDPILRPLKHGEVAVSFISDSMERGVLPESELRLVDRTIPPGEVCKRTIDDVQSGVVLNVHVKGRLAHVISGEEVPGWKTIDDLEDRQVPEIGDYVIYDDWIGQVLEVFDEALVEVQSSGQIVKLPELSSRLSVGERGTDIMPTSPFSNFTSMIGSVFGNRASVDTVLDVKHTVFAISWLAINQSLNPGEAEKRRRPKRFWAGKDLADLTLIQGCADLEMHVGDRVHLKDDTDLSVTRHGEERMGVGVLTVNTYQVLQTETTLNVLWQDGTTETVLARDVIPYLNPDEYDCWPGDYVFWKGEDEKKTVIVQSVNAVQRTATVMFRDTGITELVSLLELDPLGNSDLSTLGPHSTVDGLGVRRSEFVFIHRPGETNGHEPPRVPRIGELEPWVREAPLDDIEQVVGWRKEMADLGMEIARRTSEEAEIFHVKRPISGDGNLLWIGEVTGLNLNGTVEVTHPGGITKTYPLERLTRLHDGIEQLEEDLYDQEGHEHDDLAGDEVWPIEDGVWHPTTFDSEDGWVDEEEEVNVISDIDTASNGNGPMDLDSMEIDIAGWGKPSVLDPSSPSSPSQNAARNELTEEVAVKNQIPVNSRETMVHMISSPAIPLSPLRAPIQTPGEDATGLVAPIIPSTNSSSSSTMLSKDYIYKDQTKHTTNGDSNLEAKNRTDPVTETMKSEAKEELTWKRFDILPCAPVDHAFYSSFPAQPAKSFLNRLNREYRALANSLPDTIVVRAYEDRTDLLRSLIIGPENTPYEDAPFVIDWMLDSRFPNSPPIAHFLSWTNGNGRVNPNLYEEGKVCLSILGTWAGDRSETWSAARSSLLQTFVSIQGLVLVKEPWFCEPAYDKLRGTEEGTVNSRLYNEKAFVLSRGFVRRALEIPLGSLEEEINWLYYTHGRLKKVLDDSRSLIERSRANPDPSREELEKERLADVAVPRLTAGGIITLERTLSKLQASLDSHTAET